MSTAVRDARLEAGYSLNELADKTYCSSSALSNYERGVRPIPEEVLGAIVEHTGSFKLALNRCVNCKAGLLRIPFLERVSTNQVEVQQKVIEELREAADALEGISLINKATWDNLSPGEQEGFEYAMEQLLDVLPAIVMMLYVASKRFGRNTREYFDRLYAKMRAKQYL